MPRTTETAGLSSQELVAVIRDCEDWLACYEWLGAEEYAEAIAELKAKRDAADAELPRVVAREKAAMAQSDRMRGSTVSLRTSGPRLRLGPVPKPRRGARARGAGRPKAQSTRSSARSGDSGDDSPSDKTEPPRRRLCALCNRELPPGKRKYCSDRHAVRDRVRRKRERERARDVTPRIPSTADDRRYRTWEPGDYERLLARLGCRCNGSHLVFREDAPRCRKCGHDYEDPPRAEAPFYGFLRREAVVA
jgi:hypothetical protein